MSTLFSLATPTSLRAHGGSDPWVWMVKESLDRDYALHDAVMTSGAATVASYAVKLAQGGLHFPLQYQFSQISPLHLAVFRNRLDLVRVLCSHRATAPLVRAPDRWHRTPLVYAAIEGNVEIAACLIEHGGEVNTPSGPTPLHVACAARGGTVDARRSLVELLLMCRANAGDTSGDTVLHAALEPQDDLSVVLVATLVRALGAKALRAPSKTRAAGITPMHLLLATPWRDTATQLAALRAVLGVLASFRDDDGPAAIAAAAGLRGTDPFLVADDIGHTPWISLIGWVNANPTPAAFEMVAAILHARLTLEQIQDLRAMNVNQAMPTSFWPGLHGISPMARRTILHALGDVDGPQSPVPLPAPAPGLMLTGAITATTAPPPVSQRAPTVAPAGSMTTDRPAFAQPLVSPAEMHFKFRDAVATAMQAAWQWQSDPAAAPMPSYTLYSAPPSTYSASLPRPPAGTVALPIITAAGGMAPTTNSSTMPTGLVAYPLYPGAYRPPPAYHAALRPAMTGTTPLPMTAGAAAATVPPNLVGAIRPPNLVGVGRPPNVAATVPPPSPVPTIPTPGPAVTAAGVPLLPRPRHDPQLPPDMAPTTVTSAAPPAQLSSMQLKARPSTPSVRFSNVAAPASDGTPAAPPPPHRAPQPSSAPSASNIPVASQPNTNFDALAPVQEDRRSLSSEMAIPLPASTPSPADDSAPIAARGTVEALPCRPFVTMPATFAPSVAPASAAGGAATIVVPDSEPSIELADLDSPPPPPVHPTGTTTTALSHSKSRRRPSKSAADPTYDPSLEVPAPPSSTRSKRSKMPADLVINPGDIIALLPDPHQASGDPAWLAIAGSKHSIHYASQGKAKVSLRYLKRAKDQSNAPDGTVAYRVLRRLDRVPISQLMPAHPGPIYIARPHADSPALVAPTSAFDPAMARAYVFVEDEARAFETARELTDAAAAASAGRSSEGRPNAAAAAAPAAEPLGNDDEEMAQGEGHSAAGEDGHGYDEANDGVVMLDEPAAAVAAKSEVRHHGRFMDSALYDEGIFAAGWRPRAPATQEQQRHPPLLMRLPKRARSASLDAAAAAGTTPRPAKRRDATEEETATPLPAGPE
ncbi:hypothetical protein GGF31_000110 [Allomyces arbusculus]|nr:hypothetical protein GGF31_000110 [Allomyces arbusculus]